MPIIIDAMGGDRAPEDVLEGVRLFREEDPLTELILVGREEELQNAAERLGCELVHAPTVVGMHESRQPFRDRGHGVRVGQAVQRAHLGAPAHAAGLPVHAPVPDAGLLRDAVQLPGGHGCA